MSFVPSADHQLLDARPQDAALDPQLGSLVDVALRVNHEHPATRHNDVVAEVWSRVATETPPVQLLAVSLVPL